MIPSGRLIRLDNELVQTFQPMSESFSQVMVSVAFESRKIHLLTTIMLAVHTHSPKAGQGMNVSMQDSKPPEPTPADTSTESPRQLSI